MSGRIRCFLMIDAGIARVSLRRFRHDSTCQGLTGVHDAMTPLGDLPSEAPVDEPHWDVRPESPPHDDPRWPTVCQCGYVFEPSDEWQVFQRQLYRGIHPERGELLCTLPEMPAGAIWRASWFEKIAEYCGPDGHSYGCMLPNGVDWMMDGCSWIAGPDGKNVAGPHWTRTGDAPDFAVRPSILARQGKGDEFHALLTNGWLEPC
jgi:hypothetical protein